LGEFGFVVSDVQSPVVWKCVGRVRISPILRPATLLANYQKICYVHFPDNMCSVIAARRDSTVDLSGI
jgi:hypothetical protein